MRRQHWLLALLLAIAPAQSRRIRVAHIAPFVGRHDGGLLVNVTGRGFVVATNPKCRFGAMEVLATVRSVTWIQCYTPVNTDFRPETYQVYNAQDVTLEISLNGVDWTSSGRRFTYYDHARVIVSLFEPQGGPITGGTAITLHGSSFRYSEYLRCSWDDNNDPALKVVATYVNYHVMKCESPPVATAGEYSLEIALDDFHFTNVDRKFTYYDPATLLVTGVDPIGGPTSGGTLIEVLGAGFAQLGGQRQHGAPAFSENASIYRNQRVSHGVFCKFSFDAKLHQSTPSFIDGHQDPWCATLDTTSYEAFDVTYWAQYDGRATSRTLPTEGEAALSRAASNSHKRNYTCFTPSTTPSLGAMSSVVEATYKSPDRMLCEAPKFAGVLRNNRALLRVHVTLNGDFHDVTALSNSNVTYQIYDPREARLQTMLRTGGPINGSTYTVLYGKLFFDFSSVTRVNYEHLLRCRWRDAETEATWLSETSVACYSPRLYGFGHRQAVSVDLTYNGQDYLNGPNMIFTYSPRDHYQIDGVCQDDNGHLTGGGTCANNYTGIAVSALFPFGGPATGETHIVVLGRLFEVQGPSILCKFGNLSMVNATFLNDTAVLCTSPPAPHMTGEKFVDHAVEVTLNGEANFLTDSQVPFVYYDHNATLAVSSIYPRAGPKTGGNTITVYGKGFRVLGGSLVRPCKGITLNETNSEQFFGEGRTEGSLSRGRNYGVGDRRVCDEPALDGTNRGLQCLFGDLPAVHAYLLPLNASDPLVPRDPNDEVEDDRVGTALICESPALPKEEEESYIPGENERQLLPGTPKTICLEITLNGNRSQATKDCVEFIYYDA